MYNKNDVAKYRYLITDNCVPRTNNEGIQYISGVEYQSKYRKSPIDSRMNLVSIGSTRDFEEYINYYMFIVGVINNTNQSGDISNDINNHLDMGYLPVYMAPSYMPETLFDKFRVSLVNNKIKFITTRQLRLGEYSVQGEAKDIWCSRNSIAEYMGISALDIKILEFIKEVIK